MIKKVGAAYLFGVSNGFQQGTRDNVFKIQVYQHNIEDSIGIISQLRLCNREDVFMNRLGGRGSGQEECYRYYLKHNTIWKHRDGVFSLRDYSNRRIAKVRTRVVKIYKNSKEEFPERKARDVIIMKVDMVKWELRFYINDKLFGQKIDIAPHPKYYPVIHGTNAGKYRVLL